jgi:hypothetical protein
MLGEYVESKLEGIAMKEPIKVEVGQRWRDNKTARVFTVASIDKDSAWPVNLKPYGSWELSMEGMTFLGWAPGFGPQPPAEAPHFCGLNCYAQGCPLGRIKPPSLRAPELTDENWRPVSALSLIQARKPPDPWRPSVDEYDLLPDA